jgi:carbon-monoxide dehydrogenase large subunit
VTGFGGRFGIGQALSEQAVYDGATAQMLTGSFMDYAMPRAGDVPLIHTHADAGVPSPKNPLGVKGAGEAGTISAPATLVHAVLDALAPLSVCEIDMPLTPLTVWHAIQNAKPT